MEVVSELQSLALIQERIRWLEAEKSDGLAVAAHGAARGGIFETS